MRSVVGAGTFRLSPTTWLEELLLISVGYGYGLNKFNLTALYLQSVPICPMYIGKGGIAFYAHLSENHHRCLAGSRPNVIISGFLAVTRMMIFVDVATVRETVVPVCEPLDV